MFARTALLPLGLMLAFQWAPVPDARAQCRLCGTPSTLPDEAQSGDPIDLQIEAILDFDRLVVMGEGAGAAILRPDGTRLATGSVEAISGRAVVGEARVRGTPGRAVRIDLPSTIELHSLEGARITIDEIVTDLDSSPRLDSAGNLTFRFGGRVRLSGSSDGDFRGNLPITVEYL